MSSTLAVSHNININANANILKKGYPQYVPPVVKSAPAPETFTPAEPAPELKTKDQLIEKIKEWVKIDNEIRLLQKENKKRLAEKKKVSGELMQVMRANQIDAFDINDGQILYDKRNVKKPITKTALLSILTTYYKGDAVKAQETNQYILENREDVVREKIVRKLTNTAKKDATPTAKTS
jgi:hypothetical protein